MYPAGRQDQAPAIERRQKTRAPQALDAERSLALMRLDHASSRACPRGAGAFPAPAAGVGGSRGVGWLASAISNTSSIHFTGRISSLPLMLSGISVRSFSLSTGNHDGGDAAAMRREQLLLQIRRWAALRRAA